jgi:hypothetical protein
MNLSFEYGPTTAYGNTMTTLPATLRSLATEPFSAVLSSLDPNTLIHYRAKGVSTTSNQTVYGQDMTFDPIPQPTLTGLQVVCQGTAEVIYFSETGKSNYQWTIMQGGTVAYGGDPTSSFVMVTWNNPGLQSVSVNYQNSNGLAAPSPTVLSVNVLPTLPVSVSIAASANGICAGALVAFAATAVNGGQIPVYQWQVNGINAGTNSPDYSYVPANGDVVTCILTSSEVCTTGNPDTSNAITMTVNPLLPVSVGIVASANPVTAGIPVTFTATPVNGGSNPQYQWKVNGVNTGTNNAAYTYVPVNGDMVTCVLTSDEGCVTGNPATSNTISMAVNPVVPVNTSATGTITSGQSQCYNATQTITVAGGGNTFVVQNGGSATMIAGQNIFYLPGTMVESGGYMHGWITTNNQYCGSQPPALVATVTGTDDQEVTGDVAFRIYPNPTTGSFNLDCTGMEIAGTMTVRIYDMRGTRVFAKELRGGVSHQLSVAGKPAGVYFVKVVSNGGAATMKLILK